MTTPLLSLDAAKRHLRIDPEVTDFDADLTVKILEASALCLEYIKAPDRERRAGEGAPKDWTEATVPDGFRAAVELQLSQLFDDRNAGDSDNPAVAMGYLTPAITAILHRWRDPALA